MQKIDKTYPNLFGKEDFEGFIYMNTDFAPAAWNTVKGFFCSSGITKRKFEKSQPLSFSYVQMLKENPKRLETELRIESIRINLFPQHVSRLEGLFVFDEIKSISQTWGEKAWGGHFDTKYLTDVGVASEKSSRVDSNWITNMQDENNNLKENWAEMAIKYWSGDAYPGVQPLWERIVEGYITIWGTEIRYQAHNFLKKHFPHSLNMMAYYINCNAVASTCGQAVPFAILKNGKLIFEYYIDEYDKSDPLFSQKIIDALKKDPELICAYRDKNEIMKLPDFTEYIIEMDLEKESNAAYITLDDNFNLFSNIEIEEYKNKS